MKLLFPAICLFLLFIRTAPVAGAGVAPPDSTKASVKINPRVTYQTITSLSGNYCQALYTPYAQDEVGRFTLTTLKPTHVRFPIPVKKWEPENDNSNPAETRPEAYVMEGVMGDLFNFLREMKTTPGVQNLTASVWDVPEWLVSNPQENQKRRIPRNLYPEFVESVVRFLQVAKGQYGVEIDYFSVNEADGGYQLLFTAPEMIELIRVAGPVFERAGLKTKFLTGDVHKTAAIVPYATPILQETSIRKYLGPISYHSWWSDSVSDKEFRAIAALGKQYGLPVWCAELGYDAFLYKQKEAHQTWSNAWNTAKIYHRVLTLSGATVTQYWTLQNNFPIASADGKPYPAWYVHKQLADNLPAGTQIVEAVSSDDKLWALAARGEGRHFMTQLLNTSTVEKEVTLSGLPKDALQQVLMHDGEKGKEMGSHKPKAGKLTLKLPPQSITLLTTRR